MGFLLAVVVEAEALRPGANPVQSDM